MRGLGTIYNVAGILLGGTIGMLFGKCIRPQMQKTLLQAVGICVMFLGIAGCMEEIFAVTPDGLQSGGKAKKYTTDQSAEQKCSVEFLNRLPFLFFLLVRFLISS